MTHATVHQVFAATAARTPQAEFLFTESVTAAAYGIAAGAIRWAKPPRKSSGCAPPTRRPATATATASACC